MAKTKEIKEILVEELENKKSFTANWETQCDVGGEDIMEGDIFYFMGEKKKVCNWCYKEMMEVLEAI